MTDAETIADLSAKCAMMAEAHELVWKGFYDKQLKRAEQAEAKLAQVSEQLRLCNIDQFNAESRLAALLRERKEQP